MAIRRLFAGLAIGILILGITSAATAETLNYKFYTRVVKSETFLIPDVDGHEVGLNVRDGAYTFENGDVAFGTTIVFFDRTKGVGSLNQYGTFTFRDGSTIVTRTVGTTGGTAAKSTGEIIHGTGRFQGIKGTVMSPEIKFFRLEKGESHPKSFGDGVLNYTLPPK